jgi:pimeloyl-ACP methyl ester carboxylesterase
MLMKERITQLVDIGSTRIAYRAFGCGEPVILLQRFRGSTDDWDPGFLNPNSRRVIAFDGAGVGESAGGVPPNLEEAADVAVAPYPFGTPSDLVRRHAAPARFRRPI